MDVAFLPTFDPATHIDYCELDAHAQSVRRTYDMPAAWRAWDLLRPFLSRSQEISMRQRSVICATGSEGGRYVFYKNDLWAVTENVTDDPQFVCFHPPDEKKFPLDDVVLTKFLWLTSDEEKFRWYANFQEHPWADTYRLILGRERNKIRVMQAIMSAIVTRWVAGYAFDKGIPEGIDHLVTNFTDEGMRLEDLYAHHPKLMWRMAKRYWDYMEQVDRDTLGPYLDEELQKAEAHYAR